MTLRSFRLKDETASSMLEDPGPYKREALRDILDAFPERRFVLIGDSTEDDAEVFADAAVSEQRVVFVAIRAAPGGEADQRRAREALRKLGADRWMVFNDPTDIPVERIVAEVRERR